MLKTESSSYYQCLLTIDTPLFGYRLLDDYYKMVLKKSIDMTCVDVNAIGENNSNSLSSFCDIQDLFFRSGIKRNFLFLVMISCLRIFNYWM